jgi:hypothetical protein
MHQGSKAFILVSSEDLRGFEALGLTWRSRERLLEHSWVSGLFLIPMKVVNGNGEGG